MQRRKRAFDRHSVVKQPQAVQRMSLVSIDSIPFPQLNSEKLVLSKENSFLSYFFFNLCNANVMIQKYSGHSFISCISRCSIFGLEIRSKFVLELTNTGFFRREANFIDKSSDSELSKIGEQILSLVC